MVRRLQAGAWLWHTIQGVDDWCIYGMRDPQRAVLVESGNAVRLEHELRAPLRRGRLHELNNRLLRGTVVPGRKRIGLRDGLCPSKARPAPITSEKAKGR